MFYLQTLNSHSGYFLGTLFFYARPEKTEMQREKACSGPTSVTCLRQSSSFLYCTVKKSCSGRVFYRRLDFRLPSITKPVRVSSLNEASAGRKMDGQKRRLLAWPHPSKSQRGIETALLLSSERHASAHTFCSSRAEQNNRGTQGDRSHFP